MFLPKFHHWFLLLTLMLLLSCQEEKQTEPAAEVISIPIPAEFPGMDIPPDNLPTRGRIALGRRLYYDSILGNGQAACANCHLQSRGFTVNRPKGQMPVLPHVNLAWKRNFMWDGSEQGSLEEVMQFEVDEFFATDLSRLNEHSSYRQKFKQEYNADIIGSEHVAKALAQFTRTLISGNSKYDRVMRGEATFDPLEKKGLELFNSGTIACFHCHTPPLFTDDALHNTGLDTSFGDPLHQGHYRVSGDNMDLGKFRTPTLRNVALRTTFMHDGRFESLMEVMQFYNNQVLLHPYLDPLMVKPGSTTELKLSEQELKELVAFLRTLTDSSFISNPDFAKP